MLKALLGQIQQVTTATILYRDFRAAINEAVGNYWIRGQDRFLQIGEIVEDLLAGKGIEEYQNFVPDVQQVKEEDFKEVAGRILRTDKAVIIRMQRK